MDDRQLTRYSRHILLDEIDIAGQQRLNQATVLVVGCGGLASAALPYLAAAGVGRLLLADDDTVALSNLQRQVCYAETDVGRAKAEVMAGFLQRLNSSIDIETHRLRLDEAGLAELAAGADVLLDCSDNAATRHALNRVSVAAGKPLVSGAAVRFTGQLAVFDPRREHSPCYACLFGTDTFDDGPCALFGVFGPLVGVVGTAQAAATLRLLLDLDGGAQVGLWQQYQGLSGQWQTLSLARQADCPVCAGRRHDCAHANAHSAAHEHEGVPP